MKKYTKFIALCLSSALCLGITSGCKNTDDSYTGNTNEENETIIINDLFEPLTDINEDGKNIYFITKKLDDSLYWDVVKEGVKESAEEEGVNIYIGGSEEETDWQKQVYLVDYLLEHEADGIILAPDDSTQLSESVDKINNAGIPLVLTDTTTDSDNYIECYMTDNLIAGEKAAAEMLNQLYSMGIDENEEIEVMIQASIEASQTVKDRIIGFKNYWTDHSPINWVIAPTAVYGTGSATNSKENAYKIFDENPKLRGIFTVTADTTNAAAEMLEELNTTDIALVGFDYNEYIGARISDPFSHTSVVIQNQYDMGYLAVKTLNSVINGSEYTKDDDFYDTGIVVANYAQLELSEVRTAIEHNQTQSK